MLSSFLISTGFQQSAAYPSLHTFRCNGTFIYLLVYVDDILLTGNSSTEVNHAITQLQLRFQMQNLGTLSTFLGIQTMHNPLGLHLHQQSYVMDIHHYFGMNNCHPLPNPSTLKVMAVPFLLSSNCRSNSISYNYKARPCFCRKSPLSAYASPIKYTFFTLEVCLTIHQRYLIQGHFHSAQQSYAHCFQ